MKYGAADAHGADFIFLLLVCHSILFVLLALNFYLILEGILQEAGNRRINLPDESFNSIFPDTFASFVIFFNETLAIFLNGKRLGELW